MRNTTYILLSTFLLLAGCNQDTAKPNATKTPLQKQIKLSDADINTIKQNADLGAQLLVRKALMNEMKTEKLTSVQEQRLDNLKKNLEMEYYLEIQASKGIQVSDAELLSTYEKYSKKINKDINPEIVLSQIKEQIYLQKLNENKTKVINNLVKKYELNALLNEYIKSNGLNKEKLNDETKKKDVKKIEQTNSTKKEQNKNSNKINNVKKDK